MESNAEELQVPVSRLSADELVGVVTAYLDDVEKGDSVTLLTFAVRIAMRFGASVATHDDLVERCLHRRIDGTSLAIELAPRASRAMKEKVLMNMLGFFGVHNVKKAIAFADSVLGRTLEANELNRLLTWCGYFETADEKKNRDIILAYASENCPGEAEALRKWCKEKEENGPGIY